MLRSCTLLALLLLLTACFSVGDFGTYWTQAQIDPALTGRWQSDSEGELVFTERDGVHHGTKERQDRPPGHFSLQGSFQAKSLTLGKYHYLLVVDGSARGLMWRYAIKGKLLVCYKLNTDMLTSLPPPPSTVDWEQYQGHLPKGQVTMIEKSYAVQITRLDAPTVQWLAALPPDEVFWDRQAIFQKMP